MLSHISIKQFTVVDSLEIDFASGLTVITGETGAGKSITLDALALCLGDRADPTAIRPGSNKAEITASFDISHLNAAKNWLEERDLLLEDECLLRRTLTREGRSRAYINGTPATLQDCASLGALLADIHSQHAHQSLLRRNQQRQLLDHFADAGRDVAAVAEHAVEWRELEQQLETLKNLQRDTADREQLLRYQVNELDELALADGELEKLESEQRQLENADAIQRQASTAIELCDTQHAGVRQTLSTLDADLHEGKEIANIREMLESSAIQLQEAGSELSLYLSSRESDPERLDTVQSRLELIYAQARKHRVMPEALIQHHATLSEELASLDSSDERVAALEAAIQTALEAYTKAATSLSKRRSKAAKKLEKDVARLLKRLGMAECVFNIALSTRPDGTPHPNGDEEIDLLISTTPGAPPQGLGKIASGGELSRISLAIQVATAGSTTVPCMIFDEVDVGIGGAVAEVVGRLLAEMGEQAQIICVTHLAQVAAQGNQHLRVEKRGKGAERSSDIVELDKDARVEELARMIGGVTITDSTRSHAKEMLSTGSGSNSGSTSHAA